MPYPGIWMTESEQISYRVVPKAACSSIGQILYYTEHGTFFDGDIHDARHGIHKWTLEHSQPLISRAVESPDTYKFSCVRNPYQQILLSFLIKFVVCNEAAAASAKHECRFRSKTMISRVRARMGNKLSTKSDHSGGFCCLPEIPYNGIVRWRPIFTGRRLRIILQRWWSMGAGSTVFFEWNGLMMACSRYLTGSRPHILSTSLLCRASTSHKCTGLSVRIRWPIILMICPCI